MTPSLVEIAVFYALTWAGMALLLRDPLSRWLQRPVPWAVTVAVNLRIMSIYLGT